MANFIGENHDFLYRALSHCNITKNVYKKIVRKLIALSNKRKKGWILLDDTVINKQYSRTIEGIAEIYDSGQKRPIKGFSAVVLCWSNGEITIPIDFSCWYKKEVLQEHYKTKINLAMNLIEQNIDLPFSFFLADGLYASKNFIQYLMESNIKFEMKIASNRVIETPNGHKAQLKKHPKLKLKRNQRIKTIKAQWHYKTLYFTVVKRKKRNNEWAITYQVSNIKTSKDKEHLEKYQLRWSIEMLFRTTKQKLGLNHCQCRSAEKQKAHIYSVFLAYIFLQDKKFNENSANVEQALYAFQLAKPHKQRSAINRFTDNFHAFA